MGFPSEKQDRPRRGRPRILSDQEEALLGACGALAENGSRRGRLNVHYRRRAVAVLKDAPEFLWLVDFEAMKRGDPHAWRPTILTELGRIADDQALRAVARSICVYKPKAVEAVAMIRRTRLGIRRPAEALDLTKTLIGAINDYIGRHPDTTRQQVRAALDNAADAFEVAAEGPGE